MELLRPAGEVTDLLDPYRAVDRSGGPGPCWVMANMVGGLDGTAAIGGRVGALSHDVDQELFKLMRTLADAVLVGAETVRREGYGPVRLPEESRAERRAAGKPEVPPLVVVSRSLNLDLGSSAFTHAAAGSATTVLTCAAAGEQALARVRSHAPVMVAGDERVELPLAFEALAAAGYRAVLCEGGPTLLGEVASGGYLDELCLTLSPVMGGDPLPIAVTPPGGGMTTMALKQVLEHQGTLFLRYQRRPG